ncbi:AAA family ATPase [Thioalkalicoccus limnaeus]|uniref:AAA family ATPase n=1 Tax=Thioalkalicoccus limnaeus TaxID=120681 RepID=A0ABV4BD83_9GAMM
MTPFGRSGPVPTQRPANLERLLTSAGAVLLGKEAELKLAVTCLLARGHLLIEDVPGVGKTTLAHLLARLLGLHQTRIQFTSDLLPADILGVSIYERHEERFRFHPGPIFAQLVLADEINRATPKAQSALLEAMEERQVTVEGTTRSLPRPFFVIATQNPAYQVGTFPLPESQLDRFLMRIELGYPPAEQEKELLAGEDRRAMIERQPAVIGVDELLALQATVDRVHASPAIIEYCHEILLFTRRCGHFPHGLSPRAGLGLLRSARAWALLDGRDFVLPEDVQTVLTPCTVHRLGDSGSQRTGRTDHQAIADLILDGVPVP